jgi:ketosteroid isomerase-like protein
MVLKSPNDRGADGSRGVAFAFALFLIAAAAFWFALFWRSEERVLRRRLVRLAKLAEKTSTETPLSAMNRMRQIGDYFAAEIELVPGSGLPTAMGRQEVLFFVQNVRSSLQKLQVRVREQRVSVSPDRAVATAHVVVQVTVQHAGETTTEVREGIVEWRRVNDRWQIYRLKAADTIRNPALPGTGVSF